MHHSTPTLFFSLLLPTTGTLTTPNWWPHSSPTSDCDKSTTKLPIWTHTTPTTTPCDETTTTPPIIISETTTPRTDNTSIITITTTESVCPGCGSGSTSYTYPVSETGSRSYSLVVPTSTPVVSVGVSSSSEAMSVSESYSLSVAPTTSYVPIRGVNSTLTTALSSTGVRTSVGVSASASPTQLQSNDGKGLKGGLENAGLGLMGLVVGMWML